MDKTRARRLVPQSLSCSRPPSHRETAPLYCRAHSAPSHQHGQGPPCAGTPAHAAQPSPCAPDHPHCHCTLHPPFSPFCHQHCCCIASSAACSFCCTSLVNAKHCSSVDSHSAFVCASACCLCIYHNALNWAHPVQCLGQPSVSRCTRYLLEPPPSSSFRFLCITISGSLPFAVCTTYLQPRVARYAACTRHTEA